MNDHYKAATEGLNAIREQLSAGMAPTEAVALAVTQTRAMLAVAEEQAKTNAYLQTANLIAYAQLCHTMREGWKKRSEAKNAAELAMKDATNDDEGDDF